MSEDYTKYEILGISCPMIYVEGGIADIGGVYKNSVGEVIKHIHQVTLSSFYLGQYQVTQDLYEELMETNPSDFKGNRRPVENLSWNDAKAFIKVLKEKTGKDFRLSYKSEWEYAAKGGKCSSEFKYSGSDELEDVGWFYENSNSETHEVGLLRPNELGIYDMSGNIWEWTEDNYHPDPNRATRRIIRGGSFLCGADNCIPCYYSHRPPDIQNKHTGLRLALSL